MSESVSIQVTGMKCGGCETNINEKLMTLQGVISVSAKHKENLVDVEFDPELTELDAIEDAIVDAGFSVQ